MFMRRVALVMVGLLGLAPLAQADSVGAYIGTGFWRHNPQGTLRYQGSDMDLDRDLGMGSKTEGFTWVSIEHPVPLLPNFRFQYNKLSMSGNANTSVTFGGTSFSGAVSSDTKLDQYDATMYYQVLDNWVNLDLGVNIRYIDGKVTLTDSGNRESKTFSTTIPMLYATALFNLPFTGLSAGFEGSHIQYDNNLVSDYKAKLSYEWSSGLGMEGGWRHQQYKLDNASDVHSDIKLKGPFLDLYYHF